MKITEVFKYPLVRTKKTFPKSIDWKPDLSVELLDFRKSYRVINRKVWLKKFPKNSCRMSMPTDRLGKVRI